MTILTPSPHPLWDSLPGCQDPKLPGFLLQKLKKGEKRESRATSQVLELWPSSWVSFPAGSSEAPLPNCCAPALREGLLAFINISCGPCSYHFFSKSARLSTVCISWIYEANCCWGTKISDIGLLH